MLADGSLDALTFTSGSTAANFFALLTPEERAHASALCVASIGPSTSGTIRGLGVPVTIEARESTSAGLRDALVAYFGRRAPHPANSELCDTIGSGLGDRFTSELHGPVRLIEAHPP